MLYKHTLKYRSVSLLHVLTDLYVFASFSSRLPAVWSSTSLCVPAGVVVRQQHTWPRLRGQHAHVSAVASTSAPTARRLSTVQPPAEWCSPDLISPPPSRPHSYQAALAARGASGACDRTEQNWDFNHCLFLTGWITFYGPARVSLAPTKVWTLSIDVWLGSCLCTVAKRGWTLALPKWINWLRHFFKHYWDNQPEGVIWLKPLSSVSDKHRMPKENNADEKALNCTVILSFKMRWM